MVYLRGLENCLALTPQPSATRTLAPSFQWLVRKCAELHHQFKKPTVLSWLFHVWLIPKPRGLLADSACATRPLVI